jgi:acyl carrier protein
MSLTDQEQRLARFFVQREGEGVLDVIKTVDFFQQGLLDSLDMVGLAVFIEKEFKRKLDLTDPATMKAMARFDTLCTLAFG